MDGLFGGHGAAPLRRSSGTPLVLRPARGGEPGLRRKIWNVSPGGLVPGMRWPGAMVSLEIVHAIPEAWKRFEEREEPHWLVWHSLGRVIAWRVRWS